MYLWTKNSLINFGSLQDLDVGFLDSAQVRLGGGLHFPTVLVSHSVQQFPFPFLFARLFIFIPIPSNVSIKFPFCPMYEIYSRQTISRAS